MEGGKVFLVETRFDRDTKGLLLIPARLRTPGRMVAPGLRARCDELASLDKLSFCAYAETRGISFSFLDCNTFVYPYATFHPKKQTSTMVGLLSCVVSAIEKLDSGDSVTPEAIFRSVFPRAQIESLPATEERKMREAIFLSTGRYAKHKGKDCQKCAHGTGNTIPSRGTQLFLSKEKQLKESFTWIFSWK